MAAMAHDTQFHIDDETLLMEQETLFLEATEVLCELLDREGVSRAELARRLGKSRGFVTQTLSGEKNLTLKTLAHFATVLGYRLSVGAMPLARASRGDLPSNPVTRYSRSRGAERTDVARPQPMAAETSAQYEASTPTGSRPALELCA